MRRPVSVTSEDPNNILGLQTADLGNSRIHLGPQIFEFPLLPFDLAFKGLDAVVTLF